MMVFVICWHWWKLVGLGRIGFGAVMVRGCDGGCHDGGGEVGMMVGWIYNGLVEGCALFFRLIPS